jgi:hypothetical protein
MSPRRFFKVVDASGQALAHGYSGGPAHDDEATDRG